MKNLVVWLDGILATIPIVLIEPTLSKEKNIILQTIVAINFAKNIILQPIVDISFVWIFLDYTSMWF